MSKAVCAFCRFYRSNEPPVWPPLCGHPSSYKGRNPISGHKRMELCRDVNPDGECEMYEPGLLTRILNLAGWRR